MRVFRLSPAMFLNYKLEERAMLFWIIPVWNSVAYSNDANTLREVVRNCGGILKGFSPPPAEGS
jgi:hypothetical protein